MKSVLAPHLLAFGVHATSVIVATSRSADGAKARGGGINVERVRSEVSRLLGGFSDGDVTSLYDIYGFEDKDTSEGIDAFQDRISACSTVARPRSSRVSCRSSENGSSRATLHGS